MQAGVPLVVGRSFQEAPPGHRFRLYFSGWNDGFAASKKNDRERYLSDEAKKACLAECAELPIHSKKLLRDLCDRQKVLVSGSDLTCSVVTTSPFTTGLGIEHPLENGFAFLDPYGLPYLPGSSVKGVLRRAAEELALFEKDSQGWSVPAIWWLFGFDANSAFFVLDGNDPEPIRNERSRWKDALRDRVEGLHGEGLDLLDQFLRLACPPKSSSSATAAERVCSWIPNGTKAAQELREIHTRGALEFWDVIPEPPGGKLRIDIMNPHYGHYYQGGQPPGDWGSPIPIFFLTLPPGTRFTFIARFRPPLNWPDPVRRYFETTEDGVPRWKRLLEAAFGFAFDWLGFGAKTAVGYGRMQPQDGDQLASCAEPPAAAAPERRRSVGNAGFAGGAASPGVSGRSSTLTLIEEQIQHLTNPAAQKAEVERLVNELARQHKNPDAAVVAAHLWTKVKNVRWLARRVQKQPVFWDLVKKGGGE